MKVTTKSEGSTDTNDEEQFTTSLKSISETNYCNHVEYQNIRFLEHVNKSDVDK